MRYIFETSLHGDLLVSPHTLITSFLKKEEENKNPHQPHLPQNTSPGSFQAYTKTTLSLYHMPLARSSLSDPLSWSMLLNVSTQCLVKSVVITTAYHCHYILWLSLHTVTVNCDCQLIVTIHCDCQLIVTTCCDCHYILWLSTVIVTTCCDCHYICDCQLIVTTYCDCQLWVSQHTVIVNRFSQHTVTVNCDCQLWLSLHAVIVTTYCDCQLWVSQHTVIVNRFSQHTVTVTTYCACYYILTVTLLIAAFCDSHNVMLLWLGTATDCHMLLHPDIVRWFSIVIRAFDVHYILWYSLHPVEFNTSCDIYYILCNLLHPVIFTTACDIHYMLIFTTSCDICYIQWYSLHPVTFTIHYDNHILWL